MKKINKRLIPKDRFKKIIQLVPICCADAIIKRRNSFLLVKRGESPAKNRWWFPGGRVLFNESLQSAVKRKLKEELNIKKIKQIKFLGVGETRFKKGKFGKPAHTINNVFLVELEKKQADNIRTDKTISAYRWFEKISKNFHPYIKKSLKLAGFK